MFNTNGPLPESLSAYNKRCKRCNLVFMRAAMKTPLKTIDLYCEGCIGCVDDYGNEITVSRK